MPIFHEENRSCAGRRGHMVGNGASDWLIQSETTRKRTNQKQTIEWKSCIFQDLRLLLSIKVQSVIKQIRFTETVIK